MSKDIPTMRFVVQAGNSLKYTLYKVVVEEGEDTLYEVTSSFNYEYLSAMRDLLTEVFTVGVEVGRLQELKARVESETADRDAIKARIAELDLRKTQG